MGRDQWGRDQWDVTNGDVTNGDVTNGTRPMGIDWFEGRLVGEVVTARAARAWGAGRTVGGAGAEPWR